MGVTGSHGLLGRTLVAQWREAGADVVGWTRADFDVRDREAVRRVIGAARPDVVVHAAAYTAVDRAETEPALAVAVNRDGTSHVAAAAAAAGARCVHLSTDYVLGGEPPIPLPCDAPLHPLGAYARSKAEAEHAVRAAGGAWLIARTGWVYGPHGGNFIDTMRGLARERRTVRVVDDQHGAPTSTALIADVLWRLLSGGGATGVWHVAAAGVATWWEVARVVYAAAGADPALVAPCPTATSARAAPRPRWSVLDTTATAAAIGVPLPDWREPVDSYVRSGVVPRLAPGEAVP